RVRPGAGARPLDLGCLAPAPRAAADEARPLPHGGQARLLHPPRSFRSGAARGRRPSPRRGGGTGMNRRLVGWLLLLALFVSALPWDLAAAQPAAAQSALVPAPASHPCPDPGPIGDPCGDGCLCPCCPAHTVAPPGSGLSFKTPLPPAQG